MLAASIHSANYLAECVSLHGQLIDNFCDNMPDESVLYVSPARNRVAFTVRGDGELLAQAIRFFRTRGWVSQTEKPKPNSADYSCEFTHSEKVNEPRLALHWTSTVCKMVQVGTKMVEQPVYETVCAEPVDQPGFTEMSPHDAEEPTDGNQDTSAGSEVAPNEESAES